MASAISKRPLELYERWEALTAVFSATSPTLANPIGLVRGAPAMRKWGANPAGIVVAGARQHPDLEAIVDDDESITSADLERRTSTLAHHLATDYAITPDSTIGILSHNRAVVIEAGMAAAKLGADVVYLNSGFSAPQVQEVATREGVDLLISDQPPSPAGDPQAVRTVTLSEIRTLFAAGNGRIPSPEPPARVGRIVMLTSGTTGLPKGARRTKDASALDAAGILSCIPFVAGDPTLVAAPLFHGLGLFNANLAVALGSPLILAARFQPVAVLRAIERHEVVVFVAVPAMLQRILALPKRELDSYDASSLRIVISGGAALPGDLAKRFMDRFGPVLYNVYGSTETALATIANPQSLRRAPGTAGHPTPGTQVRIFDDEGHRVPPGTTGRIFVGSRLGFDGYTGGGGKDVVDGMLSTGDLGHVDRWGRLFIDGREDEMIVSGGENVFPHEVEECLLTYPGVAEAAVIGAPDPDYGQRLVGYIVTQADAEVDPAALKQHVHDTLARFKVPREIVFLDGLPRNATGKVLKRKLAESLITATQPPAAKQDDVDSPNQ
jgi:acyl-CoA synthetase (AMP-forming)/AMP-acid ligase II